MKLFRVLLLVIGMLSGELMAQLLPPTHDQNMRKAIELYSTIVKKGGWESVVSPYFVLERGDWSRCIPKIRHHLIVTQDIPYYTVLGDPNRFDKTMVEGVIHFQERHGLHPTGIIDRTTLEALNVPAGQRLRQLQNSYLRQQNFHPNPNAPYLIVNLPSTHLEVIQQGKVVLSLKTIVGKKTRPTPIVSSVITTTVFQPTWTVPTTIMTEDMPKKLKRLPTYFEDYNVSVFVHEGNLTRLIDPHSVDWNHTQPQEMLRYTFVQDPGPKNALGKVKFIFANPYGVYLHDTAAPELFDETYRFFSSGCVRMQTPLKLVSYLFGESFVTPTGRAIAHGVPKPLPIHTVYWTAWSDEQGRVHFRDDIYSKDATCDEAQLHGCIPVKGWQDLIPKKQLQQAGIKKETF